ncbi:MAG: hypothetical protein ABIH89_01325 [Elusimicrobiota bacterium]
MKCPACGKLNKEKRERCKHCGISMVESWQPSLKWNIKVLCIIYGVLILLYIIAKVVL